MNAVNRRIYMVGLLAVCVTVLMGCASGSGFVKPGYNFSKMGKIGVVTESRVLNGEQKKEVADLFGREIFKKGYAVVDRANLDQILNEASFQTESGLTSAEGKAKLELQNIPVMLIVNVSEFSDKVSMTAKMVEINTGSMLWMGEGTGSLKSGLGTVGGALIGAAGGAAVGNAIEQSPTARIVGAAGGAIAGGIVGKALEPEQADLVRNVIGKMTKNLPNI